MQRILIVEDDPLAAMELESIVTEATSAVVVITASVASTEKVLGEPFDLAFLDVDVTDGKTFGIARTLREKRIPYVFVSGSSIDRLPPELRYSRFIAKPYRREQIKRALLTDPMPKRASPLTPELAAEILTSAALGQLAQQTRRLETTPGDGRRTENQHRQHAQILLAISAALDANEENGPSENTAVGFQRAALLVELLADELGAAGAPFSFGIGGTVH